jgi:hypothetical protein
LQEALDRAEGDPLPSQARMDRIENNVLAQIAMASGVLPSDPETPGARLEGARHSGWRPPTKARIRFASAKIGLAALVGMGAAWSSVTGYRAYQAAFEKAPAASAALSPASSARRAHSTGPVSGPGPDEPPRILEETLPPVPSSMPTIPPAISPIALAVEDPSVARPASSPGIFVAPLAPQAPMTVAQQPAAYGSSLDAPAAVAPATTSAERELEEDLLERATRALRIDPQAALAVAEAHRRSYAAGRLAQEREVIAIRALAKLKRFDAARARAALFLTEHPESPYANDVRALAGTSMR